MSFKVGEKVKWSYWHSLNSKSRVLKQKVGIYAGLVRHKNNYSGYQLAVVKFYGNKTASRVPVNELEKVENL